MNNINIFIKYINEKQSIKMHKLLFLGIIFFYGNITLYSQTQERINIEDFYIEGTEIVLYVGEAEHIVIPDNIGITRIGNSAFRFYLSLPNENLKSIVIPEGITSIGNGAFEECFNLTSVKLPEGLVSIGLSAFSNCRSLKNITIPESVTYIGGGAFSLCQSLESIIIPKNVLSSIEDEYTFRGCTNLKNITVDERNLLYSSIDGILLNKQKNTLIKYPEGRTEQTYILPLHITAIGKGAFANSRLKNIIVHEEIDTIGDYAFDVCRQFENITINERNRAYSSSNGVLFNKDKTILIKYPANKNERTYIIPSTVTVIKDRAFLGSRNLEYMNIPSRVVSLGQEAFGDCINLKTITLSKNTKLGNSPYNRPDNFFRKGIEVIFIEDQ